MNGPEAASGLPSGQAEHTPSSAGRDLPSLSLPTAGGALRGMGEKFAANPVTGTATVSVQLPLTSVRGAEPDLTLGYDSGAGNSPWGLGWSLGVPSIVRGTDKGLPRYLDTDVFQLSGAEDLVPAAVPPPRSDGAYEITAYRPRTEGAFVRVEQWRHRTTGELHWRVTSTDNVIGVYGRDPHARIADPADPAHRVFSWLLQETSDDRGNLTRYEYKSEDRAGVDTTAPEERNRSHVANRYLKRVRYGNVEPGVAADFCCEVVFDYGEHDEHEPTPDEARPWPVRGDPFSTRRPAFEVRTYRLCRRVLMFHRIPELGPAPQLVNAVLLGHDEQPAATRLVRLTHRGYVPARRGRGYDHADLPALTFGYTERTVSGTTGTLTSEDGAVRLDGPYRWADLDGEGIAGILCEQGDAWHYRRNLGGGRFGPPRAVDPLPAGAGGRQLLDLDGDGRPAVADLDGAHPGYHERTAERGWADFAAFSRLPTLDWNDADLRFVDLTGDGLADVLVTADDGLTWYPSQGPDGFGDSETVPAGSDEERGPRLLFADAEQSVHLADMTGDGLTDLVRIGNGEIAYWPNLGRGRFGPKTTMSGAPVFDHPDRFDQRRIRLADIDGSAPTDILYLGPDAVRLWFNQAGNSFSPPEVLDGVRHPDVSATTVADVLGRGTACLVVPEPRPDGEPQVRYVDLMADGKPHLMNRVENGTGARTTVRYASSTDFYLADEAAGDPWLTRLPFPVQVIAATVAHDSVAGTAVHAAYRYRHGYFDGVEREFRGFGYVEQRDALTTSTGELHQPPAVVKRWQHLGWCPSRDRLGTPYADEYGGPPLLPGAQLPAGLTPAEEHEAARALRGQPLRTETYARDGTPKEHLSYRIVESSPRLRLVQRRGTARHAVLYVHPGESLTVYTERQVDDPRTVHELTLDVDAWGNVLRTARIAYPRKSPADAEQGRLRISVGERTVANVTDAADRWRIGVPVESRDYEIGGLAPQGPGEPFAVEHLLTGLAQAARHEVPYHEELSLLEPQRRLVARTLNTYTSDDLSDELPLGVTGLRALPWRSYRLALGPGQTAALYGDRVTDADLREAGYVRRAEGPGWWAPSARQVPDAGEFYLPTLYVDPFDAEWETEYDPHHLMPVRVHDPLRNTVEARPHYRVLRPWLLTDPNGNRSAVRFDALGMVVATAVMGKEGSTDGDVLDTGTAEAADGDDPTATVAYDLRQVPVRFHTRARERHRDPSSPWQDTWSYLDGSGRVMLSKVRAEPARGQSAERWIGTGRTVWDNKGNPVKQYEPYFAPDSGFDTEDELVRRGVTALLRYDPLGRLVGTDFPDGTRSEVVFDAWEQQDRDRNDTVRDSRWYAERAGLPDSDPQGRAARQTLAHADTATETRFDTLGRPHLAVRDNGSGQRLTTEVLRDIQGHERAVVDARGVTVLAQDFDMLGHPAHTAAADAGERWSLVDVAGEPVRGWDGRGSLLWWSYDVLRRPLASSAAAPGERTERTRVRYYYGEALADGRARNLLTRLCLVFDGAGAVRTEAVDFKGNTLAGERRLPADATAEPDWARLAPVTDPAAALSLAAPLLEAAGHRSATAYDALNRPTLITGPDGSRTAPAYNAAGLLERMQAKARSGTWTDIVRDIDYNERGRRTRIELGCGAVTAFAYERETFRLATAHTTAADGTAWQRLAYAYDPVGNVVIVDDPSQDTVFFRNTAVGARRTYVYDPVYRLVSATGREHIGQTAQPGPADAPFAPLPHANDSSALRPYTQTYDYDEAGNIRTVTHRASTGNWTRRHDTAPDSNRLLGNSLPGDPEGTYSARYPHDAHGNITAMPHLAVLDWDVENRLTHADLGGGGHVYYQYDHTGRRVRATVRQGGTTQTRTYLGICERYVHVAGGQTVEERETLHATDGTRRVALLETVTVRDGRPVPAPTPVVRYQLADHLGSSAVEIDQAGAVLSYEEYHPYGTTSFHAKTGAAGRKRYRFTGKERDEETGFTYHGARYYAPWLGRWVSPDPAGLADGPNRYVYASDRPTVMVDPSGLEDTKPNGPDTILNPRSRSKPVADFLTSVATNATKDPGTYMAALDTVRDFYVRHEHTKNLVTYDIDTQGLTEAGVSAEDISELDRVFSETGFAPVGRNAGGALIDDGTGNALLLRDVTAEEADQAQDAFLAQHQAKARAQAGELIWSLLGAMAGVQREKLRFQSVGPQSRLIRWGQGNDVQGRDVEEATRNVHAGTKLNGNRKDIDRVVYGPGGENAPAKEIGQTKSLDFTRPSYTANPGRIRTRVVGAAGNLATVNGELVGSAPKVRVDASTARVLDVATPDKPKTPEQLRAFEEAAELAAEIGVLVRYMRLR